MNIMPLLAQLALSTLGSTLKPNTPFKIPVEWIKKVVLLVAALVCAIISVTLLAGLALFWVFATLSVVEGILILAACLAAAASACYVAGRDARTLKLNTSNTPGAESLHNLAEAFKRGWHQQT